MVVRLSRCDHPSVASAAFMRQCPLALLSNDETTVFQAFRNLSMSASVVAQPRLMRTAPRASAGSTPIAASTCEGCTLPEEHAEPDDTAIPSRSNAIIAVSAFKAGNREKVVFGSRGAWRRKSPLAAPQPSGPLPAVSRNAAMRRSIVHARLRGRAAAPKPAIAGNILRSRALAALLPAALDQRHR